jgi:hypothetical protein
MKYASLALMLKDWDELAIAGVSPGKHDSIMTITEMDGRDQRIDIEYRHEVTTNHKQYLICYLVAYDQHGNRHTVKGHTWGCHDDESEDVNTFLRWFMKNLAFARSLDRDRELRMQDRIQDFFDL